MTIFIRSLALFILLMGMGSEAKTIFRAVEAYPAYNDLAHRRNQGELHLETGHIYNVLRRYREQYLVKIDKPVSSQRWVDKSCLRDDRQEPLPVTENRTGQFPYSLLVLSWHNSFCEIHPNAKECRPLNDHFANHLVLHGLWPQPPSKIYCNIPEEIVAKDRRRQWHALPNPKLPKELKRPLLRYMPGSLSALDRHEWVKHGRCYDDDPVRYFRDALTLTETVDRSMVGEYLRANIGGRISLVNLRKVFEKSFGKSYGNRLIMECRKGLLSELRIALGGKGTKLEALLGNAKPLKGGCREAIVDAPGLYRHGGRR